MKPDGVKSDFRRVYELLNRAAPDCCWWHRLRACLKDAFLAWVWIRGFGFDTAREMAVLCSARAIELQQIDDPLERRRKGREFKLEIAELALSMAKTRTSE